MPVPSAITDLSQTAGSNSPAGSESPNTADDYFRAHASFIAQLRDGKNFTDPTSLASAGTTDIGAENSLFVQIGGTTTITSFGTTYNGPRFLRFSGALTLTHNATTLNLPGAANITTEAGDTCIAIPNSTPNGWNVVQYQRGGNGPSAPVVTSLNGGQLAGLRNKIINGDFTNNVRGSVSAADDVYCLDRWYVLTETGSVTIARQQDQETGTPFNIRLTQPDVTAKQIGLAQIIEAADSKAIRGDDATLSLRIRNSDGGQVNYAVLEWSGTADSVTSDVISAWAGSPTYIANVTERAKGTLTPAANTWTDSTELNAAINSATNNVIVFIWSNADMAQNATLDIAKVQLEPGTKRTPFEHRLTGLENALCERFAQPFGFAAGQSTTTSWSASGNLRTTMRATPTIPSTPSVFIDNVGALSSVTYADTSLSTASYFRVAGGNAAAGALGNRGICYGLLVAEL